LIGLDNEKIQILTLMKIINFWMQGFFQTYIGGVKPPTDS
jgi:hypothetical protein